MLIGISTGVFVGIPICCFGVPVGTSIISTTVPIFNNSLSTFLFLLAAILLLGRGRWYDWLGGPHLDALQLDLEHRRILREPLGPQQVAVQVVVQRPKGALLHGHEAFPPAQR